MRVKYNTDMTCIICDNTKKVPKEIIKIIWESKKKNLLFLLKIVSTENVIVRKQCNIFVSW